MSAFVTIPQEFVIVTEQNPVPFAEQQIRVRVGDEAAGPYLIIEGLDGTSDCDAHCFYLSSEEEIDEFAQICKNILQQAINSYWITEVEKQSKQGKNIND